MPRTNRNVRVGAVRFPAGSEVPPEFVDRIRPEFLDGYVGAPVDDPTAPLSEVPDGTIDDVLTWVNNADGEERFDRAAAALEQEQVSDRPRAGVLDPLQKILGG